MPITLLNEVAIACTPQRLYDYVTQPWLWHEWHPSSRSARAAVPRLGVGDEFDEVVAVQPLSPLPLTLVRQTHYRVLTAQPGVLWETRGSMRDGWLHIRYEFLPQGAGTLFRRTLSFDASGPSRLLLPLLKKRQAQVSLAALDNLRRKLEAGG